MIIVRWHWSTDQKHPLKVEDFPTKKAALEWIKVMCKKRPGEAHGVIVDAVGVKIPKGCSE